MRIVHISVEFAPIAKAGGLGEVLVGLCRELSNFETVDVIIPKYDFIPPSSLKYLKMEMPEFKCLEHGKPQGNTMWSAEVEECRLHLLEARHPAGYFHRPNIYGYPDDVARFLYFSRAALEYLRLQGEHIDVLHLHEWHTAICAPLVKKELAKDLSIGSVLLTIHNLEYQGRCATWDLDAIGMKGSNYLKPDLLQEDNPALPETLNLLKGGIAFADAINTVSPSYAREIVTPGMAFNMDKTLAKHKKKLSGILNGIDYKLWNPAADPMLTANYRPDDSLATIEAAKEKNKKSLEKSFKIQNGKHPWVGAITRLVSQKGPDLLEEAIHYTLAQEGVFILLGGSPTPQIQKHFEDLKEKYKGHPHLLMHFEYDETLAHRIYSALDFLVVPSLFEPCGLTQMIALRYGTIPIVRATGGLKDTVFDCDDHTVPTSQRNGFTFAKPVAADLKNALKRAFQLRSTDPATFQSLVRRAIQSDFSWKKPTQQYLKLYRSISGVESLGGGIPISRAVNFKENS